MTNESTRPEPAQPGLTHGFTRMTPYFTVADPEALIAFMTGAKVPSDKGN